MSLRSIRIAWRVVLLAALPTVALLVAITTHVLQQRAQAAGAETELVRIETLDALSRTQATNVFPELTEVMVRIGDRRSLVADLVVISMWDLTVSRYTGADGDRMTVLGGDRSPAGVLDLEPEIGAAFDRQRASVDGLITAWADGRRPTADEIDAASQARDEADRALSDLAVTSTSDAWIVHVAAVDAVRSSWIEFAHLAPDLLGLDAADASEMAVLSGERINATERVVSILPADLRARTEAVFASDDYQRWLDASAAAARVAQGTEQPWPAPAVVDLTGDAIDLATTIDAIATEAVDQTRQEVAATADQASRDARRLLGFAVVLFVITAALTLAVLHSIVDPIRLLTSRAAAVAAGDLDRPAGEAAVGRDELSRLEAVLDDMADGLRHLSRQVRAIADGDLDDPSLAVAAPGAVGAHVQDRVEELRRASGELRTDAGTDPLTGLLNRRGLVETIRRGPAPGQQRAVLYLDLDRFKAVNDDHGHRHGDAVLIEVAARLRALVRPADPVARIGGDEFALVVDGLDDTALGALAGRIQDRVGQPIEVEGVQHRIGGSVGFAPLDDTSDTADEPVVALDRAIDEADHRMLAVKARHRAEARTA